MASEPAAAKPPPEARSPERAALAAAIEHRLRLSDHLARITAARPAQWTRVAEAEAAYEVAEEALRDARADEARGRVARLLGEVDDAPSVADAELALARAARELDEHRTVSRALEARERAATDDLAAAKTQVRRCVGEVVRTDPALAALVADYRRCRDRLVTLDSIFSACIEAGDQRPDGADRVQHVVSALPEYHASRSAEGAPWRAALAALADDPDTPLPCPA